MPEGSIHITKLNTKFRRSPEPQPEERGQQPAECMLDEAALERFGLRTSDRREPR
jgi:hypothetical protein